MIKKKKRELIEELKKSMVITKGDNLYLKFIKKSEK